MNWRQCELRIVLCMAAVFEVGQIWWCEDCERHGSFRGGFRGKGFRQHYAGCFTLYR